MLREETLQEVHDACAGGFDLRSTELSVRYRNPLFGTHTFPAATEVQALLTRALRVAESDDEAAIAATRLQLNLVTIHPFSDGNGRTARLAASMLLAHAGFRSSLLVSIEESVSSAPGRYLAALDAYRLEQICADACATPPPRPPAEPVDRDRRLARAPPLAAGGRRTPRDRRTRRGARPRRRRPSPHGEAAALAGEMTRASVEPWYLLRRRIALVDQYCPAGAGDAPLAGARRRLGAASYRRRRLSRRRLAEPIQLGAHGGGERGRHRGSGGWFEEDRGLVEPSAAALRFAVPVITVASSISRSL